MAPPVRTSRQLWIDTGLDLLATEGPGAVRVEVLAQRLGVTRGGFYRQFGGRAELVDAMLDPAREEMAQRYLDRIRRQGFQPTTPDEAGLPSDLVNARIGIGPR